MRPSGRLWGADCAPPSPPELLGSEPAAGSRRRRAGAGAPAQSLQPFHSQSHPPHPTPRCQAPAWAGGDAREGRGRGLPPLPPHMLVSLSAPSPPPHCHVGWLPWWVQWAGCCQALVRGRFRGLAGGGAPALTGGLQLLPSSLWPAPPSASSFPPPRSAASWAATWSSREWTVGRERSGRGGAGGPGGRGPSRAKVPQLLGGWLASSSGRGWSSWREWFVGSRALSACACCGACGVCPVWLPLSRTPGWWGWWQGDGGVLGPDPQALWGRLVDPPSPPPGCKQGEGVAPLQEGRRSLASLLAVPSPSLSAGPLAVWGSLLCSGMRGLWQQPPQPWGGGLQVSYGKGNA